MFPWLLELSDDTEGGFFGSELFFNHGRHFATFLVRELPAVSLEFSPATSWLQAYLHIGMLSTLTTRAESTWCGSVCVRRQGEGKVRRKKVRREKMKEGELTPVG